MTRAAYGCWARAGPAWRLAPAPRPSPCLHPPTLRTAFGSTFGSHIQEANHQAANSAWPTTHIHTAILPQGPHCRARRAGSVPAHAPSSPGIWLLTAFIAASYSGHDRNESLSKSYSSKNSRSCLMAWARRRSQGLGARIQGGVFGLYARWPLVALHQTSDGDGEASEVGVMWWWIKALHACWPSDGWGSGHGSFRHFASTWDCELCVFLLGQYAMREGGVCEFGRRRVVGSAPRSLRGCLCRSCAHRGRRRRHHNLASQMCPCGGAGMCHTLPGQSDVAEREEKRGRSGK